MLSSTVYKKIKDSQTISNGYTKHQLKMIIDCINTSVSESLPDGINLSKSGTKSEIVQSILNVLSSIPVTESSDDTESSDVTESSDITESSDDTVYSLNQQGKLLIASMKMRGKWAPRPMNSHIVNVTSMQSKTSQRRLEFSPMTEIEGGYKGFYCFENYWQGGKVIKNVDPAVSIEWWKKQQKGKRRYAGPGKSKQMKVLNAIYEDGIVRDYINSRKNVYVPEYYEMAKKAKCLAGIRKRLTDGETVVVYDFDGPRTNDGDNDILPVSIDLLKAKINDPRHPFGHGYVVAATILGIDPKEYTM
jgi:hypothetical protein